MPRYKIIIEYDGTNYAGWQKQKNSPTIAEELEIAINKFCGEEIILQGSGRTDSGVHATAQVAHFDMKNDSFSDEKINLAINFYLKQKNITVLKTSKVDDEWNARFSAKKRNYIYKILNRTPPPSIDRNRVWHVRDKLDIDAMQEAANILIGKHDFTSFRASQCQANSPVKTIDFIKIYPNTNDLILVDITARSFLHHMVRNIVGSLKLVGTHRMSIETFKEGFLIKNRSKMGPTAPACGLYLNNISY